MHLWTDYEGRTIAGAYTLGKLLRSEGRNGFFATSTSNGESAVIRLTESHFDEEEVLKRWRHVAELHQDNLIEIERVGQTNFDGVALTFALMEHNDANLDDVLKERPLTAAETMEVGKSVAAALSALHGNGLVHEHIEPANVLAVGEVVKLRSDCVRECVADGEFTSAEACEELRRRDIHDFGTLLLRCLTLEKELSATHRLAEPFGRVIPGALDGSMSLAQITTALNPPVFTPQTSPGAMNGAQPSYVAATSGRNGSSPRPLVPEGVLGAQAASAAAADETVPSSPRIRMRAQTHEVQDEPRGASKLIWMVCAGAALLLALLAWHFFSAKPAPTASTAVAAPAATAPAAPRTAAAAPRAASAPRADATQPQPPAAPASASRARSGWYVIAFTYNREDQAHAKAVRLSGNHLSMHPEVFSPSGHAPYLVSLGGPMSEEEAEAVRQRARRSGLPRDTFIRRY